MSWNYRVVTQDGGASYGIHEVYYTQDGSIRCWSESPMNPYGEDLGELRDDLERMSRAFDRPILEEINGVLHEKVT